MKRKPPPLLKNIPYMKRSHGNLSRKTSQSLVDESLSLSTDRACTLDAATLGKLVMLTDQLHATRRNLRAIARCGLGATKYKRASVH